MKKVAGIFALLLVVAVATSILDRKFLDAYNLMNIARWTGMYGILTVGAAFVIITGGIDLSVGSIVGLVGVLLPMFLVPGDVTANGMPTPIGVALVMAIALGIGLIHGLLVAKLRLQPFVVTLCGLFVYRGLARFIAGDATKGFGTGFQELKTLAAGKVFSIPVPFLILAAIAIVAAIFLNRTTHGRHLFALGQNEQAARFSGIRTDRLVILAYVISAGLAGVAGILFALDLNSIQPSGQGSFFELYAIAGAVLGGCSLRGGEGSILGVVLGTAIVRVLYNAINILGIATQLEYAVIGAVIILGVLADELVKRYVARRRSAAA